MFFIKNSQILPMYKLNLIDKSQTLLYDKSDQEKAIFQGEIKICFDAQIKFLWDRIIF